MQALVSSRILNFVMFREQKTSTGINLTKSEGPSAEKKPKQEEILTVMVEKVMKTILAS